MHTFWGKITILLAFTSLLFLGCATPTDSSEKPLLAQKLPFDLSTRSFQTQDGRTIKLVLTPDNSEQTNHSDIPPQTYRGTTTSHYLDTSSGEILAESSHSPEITEQLENLEIRQSQDGQILIIEDVSDALPSMRHILLDGDTVIYLHPGYLYPDTSDRGLLSALLNDLQLLNNGLLLQKNRAIEPLSLKHSKHPFSAGG